MIDYEEDWIIVLLRRSGGSVGGRACCFAIPSAMLTLGLLFFDDYVREIRAKYEFLGYHQGTIWSAVTAMLVFLVGFRSRTAYGRFWEGTGLLHQMRGEWFDTVSNCVTFSVKARHLYPEKVLKFRHTLVRLMSLAHGNALEEISDNQFELDTIDAHGLDIVTLRHLKDCHERCKFNKVEVLLHLIQTLITTAHIDGLIDIPPPILSRVFQTISRGFVNLLNSKKIADTKFPFPYVQSIAALLLAFTLMTPVLLSSFIPNKIIAATVTFIPVFGVASLNAIAQELENPFGMDDNDLPIAHFQEEMDKCLLMLLHPNADIVATVSPKAELDFEGLLSSLEKVRLADPARNSQQTIEAKRRVSKVKRYDTDALQEEQQREAAENGSTPATLLSPRTRLHADSDDQEETHSPSSQISITPGSPITPPKILSPRNGVSAGSEIPECQPCKQTPYTFETDERGSRSPIKNEILEIPIGRLQESTESTLDFNIDQQNLTADFKLLLRSNMSKFVKALESMTNALQDQVHLLSATPYPYLIKDSAGNDIHLLAFPTSTESNGLPLPSPDQDWGTKWENLENKQPTWHPSVDDGKTFSSL